MASVTFLGSVGGDGSTVTDDNDTITGLGNGGHRTRFVPALYQMVAVASTVVTKATEAAASAASALNAPGTQATSTTSLFIGLGSKSLTLAQTGKAFALGQWVGIVSTASPATQWMWGAITAFNSGTGDMTVDVALTRGSGTLASWAVTPAPPSLGKTTLDPPTVTSSTNFNVAAWQHAVCIGTGAQTVAYLPSSPAVGDEVLIDNATGRIDLVIARNGNLIQGLAESMTIDYDGSVRLRFIDATRGWRLA